MIISPAVPLTVSPAVRHSVCPSVHQLVGPVSLSVHQPLILSSTVGILHLPSRGLCQQELVGTVSTPREHRMDQERHKSVHFYISNNSHVQFLGNPFTINNLHLL